jgi:hypothetical protein
LESKSLSLIDVQGPIDYLSFAESPSKFVSLWSSYCSFTFPSRQKWQRSSSDNKFYLRSFSGPDLPATVSTQDQIRLSDAFKEEEHLEELHLHENSTHYLFSSSPPPYLPLLKILIPPVTRRALDFSTLLSSFPSLQTLTLNFPTDPSLAQLVSISPPPLDFRSLTCTGFVSMRQLSALLEPIIAKAKNFSHLDLRPNDSSLSFLCSALPRLSSLTSLCLNLRVCVDNRQQFFAVLPSLPLNKLVLKDSESLDEDEIEAVFACPTIRDLLIDVAVEQFSFLAASLSSATQLTSLEVRDLQNCDSECSEGILEFFSALRHSSIRSLTLNGVGFMGDNLEDCLNLLPATKLSFLYFDSCVVRENLAPPDEYTPVDRSEFVLDWNARFPNIRDRFCLIKAVQNW